MGQKVNPIGIRLGINRTWDSVWYDEKKQYAVNLHEDIRIKKFVSKEKKNAGIAKVTIERFPDRVNVNINAARPGVLIGKKGADIEDLKNQLQKLASKTVYINIVEVKKPEKNSKLIAEQIASQIEARFPYRRAVKQAITNAMRSGALGIKVMVSGRLNNAEMARTESFKEGRIPLHTLRADIDYGTAEALTSFGLIGIKVWLYNGDVLTKDQEDEEDKYSVKRKTR
ncbi:MAG: 30S ribosomal protein S3 [Spirochaetae bacterium HGW-Spirochaetae-5]|jgi:small subunit ribosomal protein S3|nr:MAG: 30S ribosomal protein S3 [Spirochaetae bacterium HGW-Spirochaetae-5]